MGKIDSRRNSTGSFGKNVGEMETSYQMFEALSFCNWERESLIFLNKDNSAIW